MAPDLASLSIEVGEVLRKHGLTLATAESCTGGWTAQVVTHTAGSSAWFDRGFVTYANDAKVAMLGVSPETLVSHGAVSLEAAGKMAAGALRNSNALISLAITGIAGPSGGSPDKPVGTVCFGWVGKTAQTSTATSHFSGEREDIRACAVAHALRGLLAQMR